MKDGWGRTIDYMRISITDRCNLRCRYCMPDGVESVPRWDILSLEEIQAAAVCAAGLGIRYIKITGGEPLVRRDCCLLVERIKKIPGIEKVTLTTNGVALGECLEELIRAGIDGINISLDTLDAECYRKITGRDCLDKVLESIRRAASFGIPVKVNAVSLDLGDENWKELIKLGESHPVDVRFIEMMPIGHGKGFPSMDHRELLEKMQAVYPHMEPDRSRHGYGPAVYWRIPGFQGSVGFISAIHGKFCADCNRVRLTSQGYLKSCLCYEDGVDLRPILRGETKRPEQDQHYRWPKELSPDDEALQGRLREAVARAISHKPKAHCFERPQDITEEADMIAIGG